MSVNIENLQLILQLQDNIMTLLASIKTLTERQNDLIERVEFLESQALK